LIASGLNTDKKQRACAEKAVRDINYFPAFLRDELERRAGRIYKAFSDKAIRDGASKSLYPILVKKTEF
jgi:hypothetical protein